MNDAIKVRIPIRYGRLSGASKSKIFTISDVSSYTFETPLIQPKLLEKKEQILAKPEAIPTDDFTPISFINPKQAGFHLLDKVLSLDDDQTSILHLPTPVIIIGSAGSGKTALTLEKIKQLRGNILYVTLSSFLVESATNFNSFSFENGHLLAYLIYFLLFK